ncbi:hypothetical protein CYLTODRAFT_477634 [Cylindrobasidium torrendii FP15055 ss-10]|uniref:Uncharacterized protein n=1 Tax=Cylindrobasidium torrendii FP15055 ss-10 TaxID=1314674 RepID=A0A0D7AUM1_9AGAR|nr:hypothetical protein CYLTODRAFT_477634 [Cylindrobasidium torrendii FP15055 ss-10]
MTSTPPVPKTRTTADDSVIQATKNIIPGRRSRSSSQSRSQEPARSPAPARPSPSPSGPPVGSFVPTYFDVACALGLSFDFNMRGLEVPWYPLLLLVISDLIKNIDKDTLRAKGLYLLIAAQYVVSVDPGRMTASGSASDTEDPQDGWAIYDLAEDSEEETQSGESGGASNETRKPSAERITTPATRQVSSQYVDFALVLTKINLQHPDPEESSPHLRRINVNSEDAILFVEGKRIRKRGEGQKGAEVYLQLAEKQSKVQAAHLFFAKAHLKEVDIVVTSGQYWRTGVVSLLREISSAERLRGLKGFEEGEITRRLIKDGDVSWDSEVYEFGTEKSTKALEKLRKRLARKIQKYAKDLNPLRDVV